MYRIQQFFEMYIDTDRVELSPPILIPHPHPHPLPVPLPYSYSRKCFIFFSVKKVYDGATTSHPQLLRICGTGIPNKIYSTTNLLTVRFQSDDTYTNAGFSAYVSFIAESDAANENDGMYNDHYYIYFMLV